MSKPTRRRFPASTAAAMVTGRALGSAASEAVAPGGKATVWMLDFASRAGFHGDEMGPDEFPNKMLLNRALKNIRSGDVLRLHWSIRDRQDRFVHVLDELPGGLLEKVFRFEHLPAQLT